MRGSAKFAFLGSLGPRTTSVSITKMPIGQLNLGNPSFDLFEAMDSRLYQVDC